MKYGIEIMRNVYDEGAGACIQVGPDADGLGCVEIQTVGKHNKEYWGDIRFSVAPAMARELGKALIASADEVEAAEGKA